jgi:hypothetical protein
LLMNTMKPERPKTREEFLRELISLHKFRIAVQGKQIAEGYIVQVINPEVCIVDIWRDGNKKSTTTHYLAFKDMGWDEFTETGYVFGPLPEPP